MPPEAVDAAVRAHGVPHVAQEVDVAHHTLRKYLTGGRVRPDVLGKLDVWLSPPELPERNRDGYFGSGA
jgi:hypothetical protein